jgi:hypothetical protein
MDIESIKNIVKKFQPLKILGFELEFEGSGLNPLGNENVSFTSNTLNNRFLSLNFSEKNSSVECRRYFIILRIHRVGDETEYYEINSFALTSWVSEKKISVEENLFTVFPNEGILEDQIRSKFSKYLEILNSEELSKIVKGEIWETRFFDWGPLGK